MGLIRFLFFLLILYVLWFMAKNYLRKQELRESERHKAHREQSKVAKVVRCKHCEVHLPEQEALRDGEDWFCTPAHKQAWLVSLQKSNFQDSNFQDSNDDDKRP